jgi:hypothetical protein
MYLPGNCRFLALHVRQSAAGMIVLWPFFRLVPAVRSSPHFRQPGVKGALMVNNTGILPPFGRNLLQLLQGFVNASFTDIYMGEPYEGGLSDRGKKVGMLEMGKAL